jgi:alpha-D-xyloside xylohydrolase
VRHVKRRAKQTEETCVIRLAAAVLASLCAVSLPAAPLASVDRHGAIVAVEPYASNVVRVTIALDRALAESAPGYGVSAKADATGWTRSATGRG